MSVISIITLLGFFLFAILLQNETINSYVKPVIPYLPVVSALIMYLIHQFDKNKRIKPKLRISDPNLLGRAITSVEDTTVRINVVNIGKSKVNLKNLIVLLEQPHKYLPLKKKRIKKKIIGHRGVSLEPNTPIEPDSDISFNFKLACLYKEDTKFVKLGVKTSTGEIFWIKARKFNKTVNEHITQYDDTINANTLSLHQICPDTDIESDIVGKLKLMADSGWDMSIIFEKTKQIFDSYEIHDIQWLGVVKDINSIEVRKRWKVHLYNSCSLRNIYTELDEHIASLFKSIVVRTYNELKDENIITIDVNEDQILNDLGIPYNIEHGDYESIFDELMLYLKPDEHLLNNQSGIWLTFGCILKEQYYFPSAVNCFEKSIELGNDIALLHLATTLNIYYDTIDEIVSLCTRYIDKNPDDYMGYYVLARAYLKQCKRSSDDTHLSKCSENIDEALKKSEDDPEVYRLSSEYYTLIGEHELAKKQRKKKEKLERDQRNKSGTSS